MNSPVLLNERKAAKIEWGRRNASGKPLDVASVRRAVGAAAERHDRMRDSACRVIEGTSIQNPYSIRRLYSSGKCT
jgi:hypothetical protein